MRRLFKIIMITTIFCLLLSVQINASTNTSAIEDVISKYKNVNINSISNEEIEEIYNEVLANYTAEELSDMIQENKDKIEEQGISSETIDKGTEFLKTTDDEQIRELIKGTDIKELIQRVQNGESIESAIIKSQKDLNKTMASGAKVILSSYIVKTILTILGIYILYKIIIRGIIYKKAGKLFISTFIPFYRDAVLFKICGYSPWIILFLLVPIIGWVIYLVYKILMKFELSIAFGHGIGFGFGVWILNPIFESIIAFSNNRYELSE